MNKDNCSTRIRDLAIVASMEAIWDAENSMDDSIKHN